MQRRRRGPGFRGDEPGTSDFATGTMAHDLRNVLQIISGNLNILSHRLGDDGAARIHIERAMAGVDLGTQLTSRALGRGSYATSTCMIAARADLEALLAAAVGPHVAVRLKMPLCLRPVAVASSDLRNALLNLAVNARDAMQAGGVLDVACSNVAGEARSWIEIAVRDNGCGMPPETAGRVLEPYFTTKGDEGSGLGLSSVQRFVEDAGGFIRIDSELGRGTTVVLRLPAA